MRAVTSPNILNDVIVGKNDPLFKPLSSFDWLHRKVRASAIDTFQEL